MTANPTPPLSEAGLTAVLGETYALVERWRMDAVNPSVDNGTGAEAMLSAADELSTALRVDAAAIAADREQAGRDALVGAAEALGELGISARAVEWMLERAGAAVRANGASDRRLSDAWMPGELP